MGMNLPADPVREIQRLFLQHASVLWGFIFGMLGDRHAADDVLQEVFLTGIERARDFRPGTSFTAWTREIARRKVFETRRKAAHGLMLSDEALAVLADDNEVLDDPWANHRQALEARIKELAPRARELVELRYSPDWPDLNLIAARVSWTVGAVKVALSRARVALRECVERRLAASGSQRPTV